MNKEEIKSISLIGIPSRTSNSYGRNMPYMRYRVLIHREDGAIINLADAFEGEELKKLGYWSPRSEAMSMTCWGTSQLFEAQISLGRWLGWDSKDWPKFSRRCKEFIGAL